MEQMQGRADYACSLVFVSHIQMSDLKIAKTDWEPASRLIITQISGDMDKADVIRWEESLHDGSGLSLNVLFMLLAPFDHCEDNVPERFAVRGRLIFHQNRGVGVDRPFDELIHFHFFQFPG